jgi:hypothetical protein
MRERTEMLGGNLRVDSGSGTGTRAKLRVPLDGRLQHPSEGSPQSKVDMRVCFITFCRENFGTQRGLGDKAEAKLPQLAEVPLFVECSRDGTTPRSGATVSCLRVSRGRSSAFRPGVSRGLPYQVLEGQEVLLALLGNEAEQLLLCEERAQKGEDLALKAAEPPVSGFAADEGAL